MTFLFFIAFFCINASCFSCIKQNTLLIYVHTGAQGISPVSYSRCDNIETCYYNICNYTSISGVTAVLLGYGTNVDVNKTKNNILCMYGQTFLIGVDINFRYVPGNARSCQTPLVCFNEICNIFGYKNVTYVMVQLLP